MYYMFHDIKQIVYVYLDDLVARSKCREDHPGHLQGIFTQFHYYNIHLIPHKFIFCVVFGRLLIFIVSKYGIMVDPLRVEAIFNFPPPSTISQLQNLQGKENLLRRLIVNYAKITKGFMHLLKKGVTFVWDEQAQFSFDTLKKALMLTPLLIPPNYGREFFLYLPDSQSTTGMVLVQEDDVK
jgi:hypothetical protein